MAPTSAKACLPLCLALVAVACAGCRTTSGIARAAANGDPQAQFEYGRRLLTGTRADKDERRALVWFHAAASQGHTRSMAAIGLCHERGFGTPANPAEARLWYRRAADAGDNSGLMGLVGMDKRAGREAETLEGLDLLSKRHDPKATAFLIKRYMDPQSPHYNPTKGVDYLRYAAMDGSREAADMLSYCYTHGLGVPKNPLLARAWKGWSP